jgi:hypothetical protein
MTKTLFTTITPLPPGVSRETVLDTFHDHLEMIDLNPAHESRTRINPPPEASPEEYHCIWYQITDKIAYFPGYSGKISFNAVFNDLSNGLQTHVYAPMGLSIKERWTIGGNAPGEPVQPAEIGIGAPVSGLYIREDVEIKCNFMMTKFVRKQLKEALATLVARLLVKSQLQEAVENNKRLTMGSHGSVRYAGSQQGSSQWGGSQHGGSEYGDSNPPTSPTAPMSPPLSGGLDMTFPKPYAQQQPQHQQRFSQYSQGSQQQPAPLNPQVHSPPQQFVTPSDNKYPQGAPPYQQTQQPQQQHFVSEIDGKPKELHAVKQDGPVELP